MTCLPFKITMNHIKNIEKKAGGVLSYMGDSIQYQNRPDLQMAQNFFENIFIEIGIQCLNTTKYIEYIQEFLDIVMQMTKLQLLSQLDLKQGH